MTTSGMRRYRTRTEAQAALVGPSGPGAVVPTLLFGRTAPLRLELGCGHGEFLSALAAAHPDEDCIGVEYDPLRVTKTAHKCRKAGALNARVFQGEAHAFLRRLPAAAFRRIYILFPDPWPKAAHRRRRLANRCLLVDLARVAAPGCRLMFASDAQDYAMLVRSQLTTLAGLWRERSCTWDAPVRFPTVFERHKRAEGARICRLEAERGPAEAPPPPWPRLSCEPPANRPAGLPDPGRC